MGPKVTKRIKDMVVGEIGYTVPWALDCEHVVLHDTTLNLVIRGDYSVCSEPQGIAQMRIEAKANGIKVFGDSVREEEFHFSGHPMMEAWNPIQVEWIE